VEVYALKGCVGRLRGRYAPVVVPAPLISEYLVAVLAAKFPDKAPDMNLSEKEVWFRAGQVSVVRWLASKLEEQENGLFEMEEL
jgi:hypothetical protein